MRLSAIKLAGFKSFVDPMALPLPSNLSAVVGPNGCGKSNIIDAVRWVLGETSMKQLRSDTMEDVIFNGCKTRKPAGRASVELSFDNSDGQVAGPYAAYTDIAVRRELTRDGTSQYYLNSAKCLKRDVTDLFLGTGLGARSGYAIIEQGMVSNMIQAKPEELRQWLEEAAGISKYKERRRETETRIRQTRDNLARLNDLRAELQQRLEALNKQAANAGKYREYKEQERRLKAEVLVLRLRALEDECQRQDAAITELARSLEDAKRKVQLAGDERAGADLAFREAEHALSAEQSRLYEAEAAAARQEQALQHARELKELKQHELQQTQRQLTELAARQQQDRRRLTELQAAQETAQGALVTAEEGERRAQGELVEAENALDREQSRWEAFTQRAEGPLMQAEVERVRVQELERAQRQTQERLQKLQTEQLALDAAPLQSSLLEADSELGRLGDALAQRQARLADLERELQQLREQQAVAEAALHETRQLLESTRGKLSSLETFQQTALGQDDAELQAWLERNELGGSPRLVTVLQVEPGWETAAEHALQGWLQASVASDLAAAAAPKGAAALVSAVEPTVPARAGTLADKVKGPSALREWLSGVWVAHNDQEAAFHLARLAEGESVMLQSGEWRGRHWRRWPKTDEDQAGVIARGLVLKQLRTQAAEHKAQVEAREAALAALRSRIQVFEGERRMLGSAQEDERGWQAQRLAFRQAQAVRLEQTQARSAQLGAESASLGTLLAQQAEELKQAGTRLTALESQAQQLREERTALQQSLSQARAALQAARAAFGRAQQDRGNAQVQIAGTRSAVTALQAGLDDLAARLTQLNGQGGELERAIAGFDAPLATQAEEIAQARIKVEQARDALRAAREVVVASEARIAQAAQRVREAEFEQDTARDAVQQARIEFQGLDSRRQGLAEQIVEAGFDRDTLLAEIAADVTAEAWEEKLAALARRIERLGPINLAAIQELDEAKARESYLATQHDDLVGALATLEEAIRKIDAETRERFRVTFDKVNEIFRARFPRLFGGGEAYLELTDDNLLDTGVRVMARPPGKRNSSIQLLSGGEKAMTAVALLLALFEMNPAPFCMLDEVDAPLDDANVARFVEVIREMSATVQFIIITHNKITMELANQLHGVTMQEPGVSRLVSVDVQQAMELTGEAA